MALIEGPMTQLVEFYVRNTTVKYNHSVWVYSWTLLVCGCCYLLCDFRALGLQSVSKCRM